MQLQLFEGDDVTSMEIPFSFPLEIGRMVLLLPPLVCVKAAVQLRRDTPWPISPVVTHPNASDKNVAISQVSSISLPSPESSNFLEAALEH